MVSGDLWLFTARPMVSWVSPNSRLWQFGDPAISRGLGFLQHPVSGNLGLVWRCGSGVGDLRLQRFGSLAIEAG